MTHPPLSSVDVNATNFKTEIIDASRGQLVIVDFWAPWCGPCKQLGPILEKQVAVTKGAAKLCKIDIDQNPQIAQQLRVQSVPTVFAFWQGQPVDGFAGALPESQIKAWIEQLIKASGAKSAAEDGLETGLKQAETFFQNGDFSTAQSIYDDLFSEYSNNAEAFAGSLRCLIATGETAKAEQLLANTTPEITNHKAIVPVRAALDLAKQAQDSGGNIDELKRKVGENPSNHQARFDLAMALYAGGLTAAAIDALLEIVRRDRKWQDDGARKQLVTFFEALGFEHPDAIEGRKKLSSVLFS